VQLKTMY